MAPSDATSHLISIATVVGVYGIKGWVKVRINLEDPASLTSLSPKGYGRSDSREKLRNFFEVDKKYIVTYALSVLPKEQLIPSKYAEQVIKKYNIDKNKPIPTKL